jgi:hypothetical protein
MYHLILGKDEDIGHKTKVACGKLLCDVKVGFTWKFRSQVTCEKCLKRIDQIQMLITKPR